MPIFVDHFIFFGFLVVLPVFVARNYRLFVASVKAGADPERLVHYRQNNRAQWGMFLALMVYWFFMDRPVADLGLSSIVTAGLLPGLAIIALLVVVLCLGWRQALRMTPEKKLETRQSLGDLIYFLPHTKSEYRGIVGVSMTAGIVEEVFYRGFLFWYLGQFLPLWAVVVVSSVVFGLCHSYQGFVGILRVTAIGLAFGLFYLLTGALWLAMLAHVLVDVLQGRALYEIVKPEMDDSGDETVSVSSVNQ